MSTYLDRLNQLEREKNSQCAPGNEPPKPPKVPFDPFGGSHPARIENISEGWLLHYADREPVQMACSPAMTREQVLQAHPHAVSAELFTPAKSAQASAADRAELERLVHRVASYHRFTDADRAEALFIALGDSENALTCFGALARDIPGKGHQ
ncbi:MAG: hypothetical protein ACKVQA_25770 [Burkholderiales bacterium]